MGLGSLAKIESKILGLSLAAQPAAFTIAVSRVRLSIALGLYAAGTQCKSGSARWRGPLGPRQFKETEATNPKVCATILNQALIC